MTIFGKHRGVVSNAPLWITVAIACTAATVPVPEASAQDAAEAPYRASAVSSPDPQFKGRWGERTITAGDLDNDGITDLFVAAPMWDDGEKADVGRVYAMSGRDRSIMFKIDSPVPQTNAKFGFYISTPGDITGDREDDIAIGTDAQDVYAGEGKECGEDEPNGCNEDQGKAWVFDGRTGDLLYDLDNPEPQGSPTNGARFGSRIGDAGDLTGDGVSEIIVGASNNDVPAGCGNTAPIPPGCRKDQGQAFIFDGKTGELFRTLNMPSEDTVPTCPSACGSFGLAVQGPGDTNKDGVVDQYVNAGSFAGLAGRSYVFSGKDGSLLLKIDSPEPQPVQIFGFQDAEPRAPGDVNGDGAADVYGNGFLYDDPNGNVDEGKSWVFDGQTGDVLLELEDPTPEEGGQFGWSLASADYNGDPAPDLFVGQSPHHTPGAEGKGGTYVFDGKDSSVLKMLELPEVVKQESTEDNLGPNLGWTVSTPGDLNDDGEPDYVAGAPFLDVGENQDEGMLYFFISGGPRTCTIVGTAGRDVLRGTSGVDVICGRGGADRIKGLAGDDIIRGGGGSDRLAGGSGNDKIAGGNGTDVLKGGRGDDILNGGQGRDTCRGGAGRDVKRSC